MKASGLLVNYCGYPNSINNLMLDNGMASLAGSLLEAGHEVMIKDFATVNTIRDFYPLRYHEELNQLIVGITTALNQHETPASEDIERLREIESHIEAFQESQLGGITKRLIRSIELRRCDFIGFKLWTGEGFVGSVKMAQVLRAHFPNLLICAGGPHIDYFKKWIYGVTNVFDALIYGEGEAIMPHLADVAIGKRKLITVPNLIFKRNGTVHMNPEVSIQHLDELPRPVYDSDIYPAVSGTRKVKIVTIDESRGCPKNCHFCMHAGKSGSSWRTKDAKLLVDELEWMSATYGFNVFRFAGSNPPAKLQHDIAQTIIERNLDFTYSAFASAGHIRDFSQLKKAGCYSLFFGVESGSQRILDTVMNKRTTTKQILDSLTASKKAGIFTAASIISPAPQEDAESRQETINLLVKAKPDSVLVCLPGLILGTEWERNREKYGFDVEDMRSFVHSMMKYRVKLTYPPELWNPIPYQVNGKGFKELVQESRSVIRTLAEHGINLGISDEIALTASCTDMAPAEFHKENLKHFASASFGHIEQMVRKVNKGALCRG